MKQFISITTRYALLVIFAVATLIASYFIIDGNYPLDSVLRVLDKYFQIILTSWPPIVLIAGLFLLVTQKEAIAYFIRSIDKVGPGGVSTHDSPIALQRENKEEVESLKKESDTPEVIAIGAEVPDQAIPEVEVAKLKEEKITLESQIKEEIKKRLFERVYGGIFGGQLNLLVALSVREKMPYSEAIEFYNQAAKVYPTLISYPVEAYFQFLITPGFIKRDFIQNTDYIVITDEGKKFIQYLQAENLSFSGKSY